MPKIKHRKFKLTDSRAKWVGSRETTLQGEPMRFNPRTAERYALDVQKEVRAMHLDVSKQIKALFDSSTVKSTMQKVKTVAMDSKTLEIVPMDYAFDSGVLSDNIEIKEVIENDYIVNIKGIAMDASITSLARILTNQLIAKWTKRFNTFGKDWTKSMIGNVESSSAKDLSRSMKTLSGGLTIKTDSITQRTRDIINASADQSTSLIKTIGSSYTTEVKQAVMRSITDDTSTFTELKSSINKMLQGKYKTYKNKAKNVALDQTRKAYTSVTASRMKDIGIDEYTWKHAGGSVKPRDYHRDVLNGQVFSLSNPPIIDLKSGERGKPGDAINCKCYMVPVVKFG